MSLAEVLVAVICGFILPRLILSAFGSQYNGLTTSITQFLGCAILLRSGIGGATRAALYKPLAYKEKDKINAIIKATDIYMKKIGIILAIIILLFATIYPSFVKYEFDWLFTFSLFIIIGVSTFAESFFGITYLTLLEADQQIWIASFIKIICYILNTIIATILIYCGFGIHIVKLGSSLIYVLHPIILSMYVKKKYQINLNVVPNNNSISQRWDAFWHQACVFVMNNTDVMVLTVFTNMLEVSVYSVYNLVANGLKRIVFSFSNGLEAALGNMIAKREENILRENIELIELIMFGISTIIYTSASLLILSFIRIYTKGIEDINYIRPMFAYILLLAQFFNCIRLPYQLVVQAAGHYKQTKKGAIIEPIINLATSIILVSKLGIIGVAVGTLLATLFRTIQYSFYMNKNIVKRNNILLLFRCIVSFLEFSCIYYSVNALELMIPENYFEWICQGILIALISTIVVGIGSIIFYRNDTIIFSNKIKKIFLNKTKLKKGA